MVTNIGRAHSSENEGKTLLLSPDYLIWRVAYHGGLRKSTIYSGSFLSVHSAIESLNDNYKSTADGGRKHASIEFKKRGTSWEDCFTYEFFFSEEGVAKFIDLFEQEGS